MALPGNAASVNISIDDATYYPIDEMNALSMNASGELVDITHFPGTYRERLQTLKDIEYSAGGFWNKADTNGQLAVRAAWLNDSTLYIKVLVNAANGWKQLVKVVSIAINTTADGVVEVAFEFTGNGDVTVVS